MPEQFHQIALAPPEAEDLPGMWIDATPEDRVPQLDKRLRNLVSRHYLPPAERQGRADLFSLPTVCALRLSERATVFGLDRVQLDDLLRFLQSAPDHPTRWREGDGFREALTRIEIALERARAGEDFAIGLSMGRDGVAVPAAWWQPEPVSPDAAAILDAMAQDRPEPDAVFRLPAGRLIRKLLGALGA